MKRYLFIFILLFSIQITLAQSDVLSQANTMLENKEYDKVISLLSSKEKRFSSDAQYFYLMGSAYIDKLQATDNFFKKGTLASKAKNNLLKAVKLQPSHIEARIRLSNYYLNAPVIAGGSNTKAKEQAEAIIKYDEVKGRMLLASIHLNKKEYSPALEEYLKIYNNYPDHKSIRYALSNAYMELKDFDKAFNYAKKSIDKFPEYLKGHYQYARIASIVKKNIKEGIDYINYYIEQPLTDGNPKKHWAYYRLALLKKAEGNTTASLEALKKALELNPDFSQAKKLLD